jgi:L-amino acid N-acyltransferase YncA
MTSDRHDDLVVRSATAADAAAIAAIYNPHVTGSIVTFEEEPVADAEMARRIAEIVPRLPWLVGAIEGTVVGYAYASPWKTRSAYRYSVETSIYMAADRAGRGLGRRLYTALLDDLRARGLQVAIGGISLPNAASVALHERLGFAPVAVFPGVGWKLGRWVDVGYWQLALGPAGRVPE